MYLPQPQIICSIRFPEYKEFWIKNRDSSVVEHLHYAEGPRFESWSRSPNQNSLNFGFLLAFSDTEGKLPYMGTGPRPGGGQPVAELRRDMAGLGPPPPQIVHRVNFSHIFEGKFILSTRESV